VRVVHGSFSGAERDLRYNRISVTEQHNHSMGRRTYPDIAVHRFSKMSEVERNTLLVRAEDDLEPFIEGVKPIIEAVRQEGDKALAHYAQKFDNAPVAAEAIAATKADIDAAFDLVGKEMVDVLSYAADNIRRFHEQQLPEKMWTKEIRPGVLVGERVTPIDSVACYSPRGKGSFPSVTLMTAVPACVAGVPNPIILTPAGPDGQVDPATLVAARLAGVDQVFKAGGAQAVAAAAYGMLANRIDPGLPAGPSETIILADPSANPRVVALDLLIESEHGNDSSSFLVTWSEELAQQVIAAVPGYWDSMSETLAGYSSTVLSGNSGGIVLTESEVDAYAFINDYAPEHLQILSKTPYEHLPHIRNASEILLGEHAAGSLANYMMGPNCVLPTSGAAHTHSPLGVNDFMKSASIGHLTEAGYNELAPRVHRFATYEGFDGHANAVSSMRTEAMQTNHSINDSQEAKPDNGSGSSTEST